MKNAADPGRGEAPEAKRVDAGGQLERDRASHGLAANPLEGILEAPGEEEERDGDRRKKAYGEGRGRMSPPEEDAGGDRGDPVHGELRRMELMKALAISKDHEASCRLGVRRFRRER